MKNELPIRTQAFLRAADLAEQYGICKGGYSRPNGTRCASGWVHEVARELGMDVSEIDPHGDRLSAMAVNDRKGTTAADVAAKLRELAFA